ncbi:MAG: ABC transporter permease, partial [Actinocatenispora sp.]
LLGWSAGFVVAGAALGSIASSVQDMTGGSREVQDMFARLGGVDGLVDAYLSATMGILGLVASGYAISAALRLRGEESAQRAEPVLATRVSRVGWVASHLTIAVLGTALLIALAGAAAGLTHGLRTHDVGAQVPRLLGAALVQVPAALLVAGIAVALVGLLPRFAVLSWAVLGVFLMLGQFGELLSLDQSVMDLSPFTHTPKLPGSAFTGTPLLWLLTVTAALIAAGLVGIRRRDIG